VGGGVGAVRGEIADDAAVLQDDDAIGVGGAVGLVGDHEDRLALVMGDAAHEGPDLDGLA